MYKVRKRKPSSALRSGLEDRVSNYLNKYGIIYSYETDKINYTIPETNHIYTPDFVFYKLDGTRMYIETKGYWDAEDRKKHFFIKTSNPDLDLRFIFARPYNKIRKNSNTTYADVCSGKLRGHSDFVVPWSAVGKNGELPLMWLNELKLDITGRSIYDIIKGKE